MIDRKLGRLPTQHDARTLKLDRYLAPTTDIPAMKNWGVVSGDWGMMRNDQIGDCTIAAAAHIILLGTAAGGAPVRISDADVVKAYSAVSGYDPVTGLNDNGAVELQVLNYWRQNGIAGHKITAFAALPLGNLRAVRQAIYEFGAVYAGVELPNTARDQAIWSVVDPGSADARPGSWGGHAIPLVGYDTAALACITWGEPLWMTDEWLNKYAMEFYAVLTPEWVQGAGNSPSGFDLARLQADLAAVTAGV